MDWSADWGCLTLDLEIISFSLPMPAAWCLNSCFSFPFILPSWFRRNHGWISFHFEQFIPGLTLASILALTTFDEPGVANSPRPHYMSSQLFQRRLMGFLFRNSSCCLLRSSYAWHKEIFYNSLRLFGHVLRAAIKVKEGVKSRWKPIGVAHDQRTVCGQDWQEKANKR